MKRGMLWIRYGLCTCLGLAVIGLAAMTSLGDEAFAGESEASGSDISV